MASGPAGQTGKLAGPETKGSSGHFPERERVARRDREGERRETEGKRDGKNKTAGAGKEREGKRREGKREREKERKERSRRRGKRERRREDEEE